MDMTINGRWKLVASLFVACIFSSVTGQNETIDATLTQSFIYSPGYSDGAYLPNLTYDYRITTSLENHTVLVTFTDCEIETFKGVCVNDVVTIYDGYNSSATTLVDRYCCLGNTHTYQSTNDTMYIVFTTDQSDQFKGFAMSVLSDGPTTSTSTTTAATTKATAAAAQSSEGSKKKYTWVIVGCCVGLLPVIIVVVVVYFYKKKQMKTCPASKPVDKWNLENATAETIPSEKIDPNYEAEATYQSEANGTANQLPPLSQSLGHETPLSQSSEPIPPFFQDNDQGQELSNVSVQEPPLSQSLEQNQ